jgi:HlyD family secretion protein
VILAASAAVLGSGGFVAGQLMGPGSNDRGGADARGSVPIIADLFRNSKATAQTASKADTGGKSTPASEWVAAAPGRVEPRNGELRIGVPILGRVVEVLVKVGDTVEEDELVIRLDDDEARANLAAAEAEEGALRRDRDRAPATAGREDVKKAEDAVYQAERGVTGARYELDFAQSARRKETGTIRNVRAARQRLADAKDRLQRERLAYAAAQVKPGLPSPGRTDSMVSVGRAKVAMVEAALDKTRIRAPASGTVLQLHAKVGEVVAPSPEAPLIVIGDQSAMRVKAEVDEGDVAKIKLGQKAFVRSPSYPGREFEGTVARIAPTLAPPRIGQRGPRRPTDVEVMEVTIDLDGKVPLLTGMRVDTFFRR